jgi:enoyl-CoA hydratase/carnithine racemase
MSAADLRREGSVFVLDLGDGENRFNPSSCSAIEDAVHVVDEASGPRALVTTASGKFWSNGLDLEWMGAHPDEIQAVIDQYHRLLAAVLGAPFATVAAVGGHAFAAGAMFAVAHDEQVMRADRGFWCLPEADLGMPFTPGMTALLAARLPRRTAHEAMLTARRYGGGDARAAGIVDEIAAEDQVLARAIERAERLAGKPSEALAAIKQRLHRPALDALRAPQTL